jgi:hypothetical protein
MPRVADYPRAALPRTLEFAAAVERLGGECGLDEVADELGARPGGTFGALASTAVKYGWVSVRRGRVRTEPRFRTYQLAYDEAERRAMLTDAIRAVPLFRQLIDRFADRTLPEDHLGRLLVREFGVPGNLAPRVAGYFLEAVVTAGLLAGGKLRPSPAGGRAPRNTARDVDAPSRIAGASGAADADAIYRIRIQGPDVESTVEITELADLELARSLLAKVERALRSRRP